MTKPANFPARKLARQLAAQNGTTARAVLLYPTHDQVIKIDGARQIKTKKYSAR